MGVNSRRPLLPAPTESIVDTTGSSMTGTDLATDVSRRTDKSSYSIPDDGSPITISTRRRSHKKEEDDTAKLSRTNNQSQTSLLIEYFEGGKHSSRLSSRPSVRVKVIPSGSRRSKDQNETIQIREGGGSSSSKRHHYTRRISLSTPSRRRTTTEPTDDQSNTDDDNATRPLEIEFVERDPGSELSNDRLLQPTSEISSMPADSMLDGSAVSGVPRRKRSQSLDKASGAAEPDLLKAPSRRRSRSLSRERIAYKVAQKLNAGDVASSSRRRSNRNESKEILESDPTDLKKRSHRYRSDEQPSIESSLLSGSNVSSHHKSGDAVSFRSGTSRSSLNNTKFLETVEDAIRRLILPELKELKKDQTVGTNKSKFERDLTSASTPKDELKRTLSKHSSAPDVSRSSIFAVDTTNDTNEEVVVTPEERRRRHKERRRAKEKTPSPDGTIRVRKGSRPENQRAYTDNDMLRRQRSKGLRDAAAAGIVGNVLTAAALSHHDSKSSLGKKSRRRRSSKSSSRTPSIHETETELVFQKHNVPPMPFRSDVDTELTRDSILSQRTDDTETPAPRHVQELIRGSPTLATPPRTPLDNQRGLSYQENDHGDIHDRAESPLGDVVLEGAAGAIAAAAAGNLLGHHFDDDMLGPEDSNQHPRALSPIQSVASDQDLHETQITEAGQEGEAEDRRYSIASLSSAPSTDLARSTRPEGGNLDSRSEVFRHSDEHGTELGYETGEPEGSREEHWNEDPLDDQYEDHISNPAMDAGFDEAEADLENDDTPRNFTKRVGANPEILNGNPVESVVASLLDPPGSSLLDTKSGLSQTRSQADSLNRSVDGGYVEDQAYSRPTSSHRGSPLKHEYDINGHDEKSFTKRLGAASPPQSVTQSEEAEHDGQYPLDTTIVGEDEEEYDDLPEDGQVQEDESEINTNPSIIQGPIGSHENRDHWPYDPTSQTTRDIQLSPAHDGHASAAVAGVLGAGLGLAAAEHTANYDQPYSRAYMDGHTFSTPPGAKDEGYISAVNPMSPSNATPEPQPKFSTLDHVNPPLLFDNNDLDDPFTGPGQQRHFSGYSHGMASPIYDSATGRGIESIESKDIIALMNHLTVRDAQRNARDTEMLVTLVRSAAEMRGSFEEMKKYIAQQDEMIIQANEKQHERTRAIGGPRPLPASRSDRQLGQLAAADYSADIQAKRKNVFKRALKSLSMKSSNDLTKIEDMLEQLLDEVEALRAAQEGRNVGTAPGTGPASLNSNGHGISNPDGYEPEGLAGTGSPGDQSGFTSNSSRPVDTRPISLRRASENRVSTVHEGDEELDSYEQPLLDREVPYDDRVTARHERGVSEPLGTPPRKPVPAGAMSQETTPRKSDEKSRKHKSSSSSFFKISRWSKTTASSVGEGIRNSIQPNRKERPISGVSRSGSDLANQDAYNAGFYDPQGDDRLRSSYTLDEEQQDNRPPSPLVPSQVSEGPVYKAHRDSFNLQHPQPQKGPTDRYQNHLEYQAQDFAPTSPTSERWGSQSSLSRLSANPNRYSGGGVRRTPVSDMAYSELSSATGPPRPPKVKDAGPLIPQRPSKISEEDERSQQSDRLGSRSNSAKFSPSSQPPQRKPTGPRPITSAGQQSPSNIKRNRYRGSPNQIDYDNDEY